MLSQKILKLIFNYFKVFLFCILWLFVSCSRYTSEKESRNFLKINKKELNSIIIMLSNINHNLWIIHFGINNYRLGLYVNQTLYRFEIDFPFYENDNDDGFWNKTYNTIKNSSKATVPFNQNLSIFLGKCEITKIEFDTIRKFLKEKDCYGIEIDVKGSVILFMIRPNSGLGYRVKENSLPLQFTHREVEEIDEHWYYFVSP